MEPARLRCGGQCLRLRCRHFCGQSRARGRALSSAAPSASGGFQFTVSEGGNRLQTVLIQATTNLADPNSWVQIGSLLPTTNPFNFTDTNAAQYPMRFYRIVAP